MATGLDTARLETQLENERQRLELAKSDIERTKLILINALGINFDLNLVLTDELKAPEGPVPTQDYAMEVALTNRPEMKAQQQPVQVSKLTLSSIKGEWSLRLGQSEKTRMHKMTVQQGRSERRGEAYASVR